MSTVILPAKLQGKTRDEVLSWIGNKVQYYYAMAEHFKQGGAQVAGGAELQFTTNENELKVETHD